MGAGGHRRQRADRLRFPLNVSVILAVIFVFLPVAVKRCQGYPDGATSSSCDSMEPEHDDDTTDRQIRSSSDSPFTIVTSKSTYTPGEELTFHIDTGDVPIKGLFAQMRPACENENCRCIGRFESSSTTKQIFCPNTNNKDRKCAVTHRNAINVFRNVTLKWKAQQLNLPLTDKIHLFITLVSDFSTYWVKLKSPEITVVNVTTTESPDSISTSTDSNRDSFESTPITSQHTLVTSPKTISNTDDFITPRLTMSTPTMPSEKYSTVTETTLAETKIPPIKTEKNISNEMTSLPTAVTMLSDTMGIMATTENPPFSTVPGFTMTLVTFDAENSTKTKSVSNITVATKIFTSSTNSVTDGNSDSETTTLRTDLQTPMTHTSMTEVSPSNTDLVSYIVDELITTADILTVTTTNNNGKTVVTTSTNPVTDEVADSETTTLKTDLQTPMTHTSMTEVSPSKTDLVSYIVDELITTADILTVTTTNNNGKTVVTTSTNPVTDENPDSETTTLRTYLTSMRQKFMTEASPSKTSSEVSSTESTFMREEGVSSATTLQSVATMTGHHTSRTSSLDTSTNYSEFIKTTDILTPTINQIDTQSNILNTAIKPVTEQPLTEISLQTQNSTVLTTSDHRTDRLITVLTKTPERQSSTLKMVTWISDEQLYTIVTTQEISMKDITTDSQLPREERSDSTRKTPKQEDPTEFQTTDDTESYSTEQVEESYIWQTTPLTTVDSTQKPSMATSASIPLTDAKRTVNITVTPEANNETIITMVFTIASLEFSPSLEDSSSQNYTMLSNAFTSTLISVYTDGTKPTNIFPVGYTEGSVIAEMNNIYNRILSEAEELEAVDDVYTAVQNNNLGDFDISSFSVRADDGSLITVNPCYISMCPGDVQCTVIGDDCVASCPDASSCENVLNQTASCRASDITTLFECLCENGYEDQRCKTTVTPSTITSTRAYTIPIANIATRTTNATVNTTDNTSTAEYNTVTPQNTSNLMTVTIVTIVLGGFGALFLLAMFVLICCMFHLLFAGRQRKRERDPETLGMLVRPNNRTRRYWPRRSPEDPTLSSDNDNTSLISHPIFTHQGGVRFPNWQNRFEERQSAQDIEMDSVYTRRRPPVRSCGSVFNYIREVLEENETISMETFDVLNSNLSLGVNADGNILFRWHLSSDGSHTNNTMDPRTAVPPL